MIVIYINKFINFINYGCENVNNEPEIANPLKRRKFEVLAKVKIGIYLLVVLYSAYAITLGTTFFNNFDRMLMGGFALILTIPIFVWMGIELIQNQKKKN